MSATKVNPTQIAGDGDGTHYLDGTGAYTAPAGGGGGGSGALTLISEQILGSAASSVSFTSIAGTYRDLVLVARVHHASANGNWWIVFNSDTTAAHYVWDYSYHASAGSSSTSDTKLLAGSYGNGAGDVGDYTVTIPGYAGTAWNKSARSVGLVLNSAQAYPQREDVAGVWKSTAAITQIDLVPDTGNFAIGTGFTLYGRG